MLNPAAAIREAGNLTSCLLESKSCTSDHEETQQQ